MDKITSLPNKDFNKYLETELVPVRSKDVTGHYGTTAKKHGKDEYMHAGGVYHYPLPICQICKKVYSKDIEHVLPFFVASAYAGLGNGSRSSTPHPNAPLLDSIYLFSCSKCNTDKSDIMFLNVPTERSPFWVIDINLLNNFLISRGIDQRSINRHVLYIKLNKLVNALNGQTGFLNSKYPNINIVDRYLREKRLIIFGKSDQTKRVLAHYLSGLDIIAYYKCFNHKLTSIIIDQLKGMDTNNETDIMNILRTNINQTNCTVYLRNVNDIISGFSTNGVKINAYDDSFINSYKTQIPSLLRSKSFFGKRKQKPRLNRLKQLVSDLKSLKKF